MMVTTSSRLDLHTSKYQAQSRLSKVSPLGRNSPQMFSPYSRSIQQPGLMVPSIPYTYHTFPCPV